MRKNGGGGGGGGNGGKNDGEIGREGKKPGRMTGSHECT